MTHGSGVSAQCGVKVSYAWLFRHVDSSTWHATRLIFAERVTAPRCGFDRSTRTMKTKDCWSCSASRRTPQVASVFPAVHPAGALTIGKRADVWNLRAAEFPVRTAGLPSRPSV